MINQTSRETLIHQLAKEVILEEGSFWLPNKKYSTPLFDVQIEKSMGAYVPDLQCEYVDGGVKKRLAIEICVTSKSSPEKINYYRENQINALEVYAGKSYDSDVFDMDLLMEQIWSEITYEKNQKWLSYY